MVHQLNIFLLLFGALQGVLLAIIFFRNRRKHRSSLYLTLFLTLAGLQLTFKIIAKSWLFEHVYAFYEVSYFLPFLAGPLLYFFIRSRVTETQFRSVELVHFLPFFYGVAYVLMVMRFGYVYTTPVDRLILMSYPRGILQVVFLVGYSWWSLRLVSGDSSGPARKSLQQFVIVVAACEGTIIVAITLLQAYYGLMPDIRILFTALTLMIYWISYKLIMQPDVFLPSGAVLIPLKLDNPTKYAHSGLKDEEADRIADQLRAAMGQQRLYLNANLSIDSLAAELQISRHYLSQVLNEKFQQTYFDYVNGYRLEEASSRLTNQKYRHYTIAAIALDSGFSSVSNFNEVFKKRFGVTPSRFRDERAGKMSA